jgi:hypothetical protein
VAKPLVGAHTIQEPAGINIRYFFSPKRKTSLPHRRKKAPASPILGPKCSILKLDGRELECSRIN